MKQITKSLEYSVIVLWNEIFHFSSEVSVVIFQELKKIGINEAEFGFLLSYIFNWQFLTADLAFDKHVFSDRWLHRIRFRRTLIKLVLDMCMQFSF